MTRYFELHRGGHRISCKLNANDTAGINKIILFCHGFAGHKDNGTVEQVVPFEAVRQFARKNQIDLIPIADADHRFLYGNTKEKVTEEIVRFFGLA